jgi:ABC-2 type transport system permease protein
MSEHLPSPGTGRNGLSRLDWIRVLVQKDVTLYFRNRFFAFITFFALAAWIVTFYLMPDTVDEVLELGLVAPDLPPAALEALTEGEEGVVIVQADSEEALKEAMLEGAYDVGAVLPPDFMAEIAAGTRARVHLYFTSEVPSDFYEVYVIVFQEWAHQLAGEPLPVEATEEVLGVDKAGAQVPPRQRLLPLLAVFLLMMETMGLSSLLSSEIVSGTLQALLITPMGTVDLFAGKTVSGVGMAFLQATLLVALTGGLSRHPLLVLTALLLGSLLVTGIGLMIGAVGRDMMSALAWGVLAILVLTLPALGVLLPGVISNWVKAIPSYYLVDTIYQVMNFDAGWREMWTNLLILFAFGLVFCGLGIAALGRKVR